MFNHKILDLIHKNLHLIQFKFEMQPNIIVFDPSKSLKRIGNLKYILNFKHQNQNKN